MVWKESLQEAACTHSQSDPCPVVLDCLRSAEPLCELRHNGKTPWQAAEENQVVVRIGLGSCGIAAGAKKTYNYFKSQLAKSGELKDRVVLKKTGCLGLCSHEVVVSVEKSDRVVFFKNVNIERASEILELYIQGDSLPEDGVLGIVRKDQEDGQKIGSLQAYLNSRVLLQNAGLIDPSSFDEYLASGGMAAFAGALKMQRRGEEGRMLSAILAAMSKSGDFCIEKERLVEFKERSGEKTVVLRALEQDTSSFTVRTILESDPYSAVEGLMVICVLLGASRGLVFLDPKFKKARVLLEDAVCQLQEAGLLGEEVLGSGFSLRIEVFPGLESAVCAEDGAVFAAVLGDRPKPGSSGKAQGGSLTCHLEDAVYAVRLGALWPGWSEHPFKGEIPETQVVSLLGRVENAGCIEVPLGTSLREIVYDYGGGVENRKVLKALQIGGASGGFLPARLIDTPLDQGLLQTLGIKRFGSILVLDQDCCIVDQTYYSLKEMSGHSCGLCIPCREGLFRLVEMLGSIKRAGQGPENLKRFQILSQLEKLAETIRDTSRCSHGSSAVTPLLTGLTYFKDEFRAHIFEERCPANQCKGLLKFKIDAELCTGCSICRERCPEDAIIGQSKFSHFIIEDRCTSCGICHEVCPFGAVSFS